MITAHEQRLNEWLEAETQDHEKTALELDDALRLLEDLVWGTNTPKYDAAKSFLRKHERLI